MTTSKKARISARCKKFQEPKLELFREPKVRFLPVEVRDHVRVNTSNRTPFALCNGEQEVEKQWIQYRYYVMDMHCAISLYAETMPKLLFRRVARELES